MRSGSDKNDIIRAMKRFVAVMNIPSPYRLHLLGELARQLEERGISLECHFMAKGHADRPKSWLNPTIPFRHRYWRDWGVGQNHFNPGLIVRLMLHRPDYLLVGGTYDALTSIFVSLTARAELKMCWIEGNAKSPGRLTGLKAWIKYLTISKYELMAVPGQQGVAFLELLAQHTTRPFPKPIILPNLVDETRFGSAQRDKRGCFDVDDVTRVCLIPSRFDPVKGLKEFFSAVEPATLLGWKLVVMGHGPEEESTLKIVRDRGLESFVRVIHSVAYDEMPRYYASADLCLIPSIRDQNPLAAVEALHSGLPLALSDQAGNVDEAVADGRNGWVLPVGDVEAYRRKLVSIWQTPLDRLREMGRISQQENAAFWRTQAAIAGFVDGVLGLRSSALGCRS